MPEAAREFARFKDNEREFMKAVRRWTIAIVAGGLALAATPTVAQQADSPPPASDSIGPRDLQNFNLQGTVTRPAETTPAPTTRAAPPSTTRTTTSSTTTQPRAVSTQPAREAATTPTRREPTPEQAATRTASADSATTRPEPSSSSARNMITTPLPPISSSLAGGSEAAAAPGFTETTENTPALEPQHRMPLWPWLLAAMALGAGGAFLFWRQQHGREVFAGGPQSDAFVVPEEPAARPRNVPPAVPGQPARAPSGPGLISTRLRPWLDISFEPIRCIVEDHQVAFEFQLALMNSGSGPAREVLIEACMINASPTQEEELKTFFANPAGQGERIATIPPLKSVELKPRVVVGREQIRVLDAGGRKVFVPLLAFNALYRWGSGEGQTSGAYLLGRDTKGEKLAPFRLDLGPRLFRGVEARPVPVAIRN